MSLGYISGTQLIDFAVTRKDGTLVNLAKVVLMDETDEATISLWDSASYSAPEWVPSHTALLISSPGLNASHKNWLSMTSDTLVDVDPATVEVARLRKFAGRMIRRAHVNPAFPRDGLFSCSQSFVLVLRKSSCCLIDDPERAVILWSHKTDRVIEYVSWALGNPKEHVLYSLADLDDRYENVEGEHSPNGV